MHKSRRCRSRLASLVALLAAFCMAAQVRAHCDSLDGPVVRDARTALEAGEVSGVLKWVAKDREAEIRDLFQQTMAVRVEGEKARALADRYFFESLVRIHREGEGEAYAGLKPAESVDPGIEAADHALESGSVDALADHMAAAVEEGIRTRFARVDERGGHKEASVEAGREWVEAYVEYIHYVESLHRLVSLGASHEHHEPGPDVD